MELQTRFNIRNKVILGMVSPSDACDLFRRRNIKAFCDACIKSLDLCGCGGYHYDDERQEMLLVVGDLAPQHKCSNPVSCLCLCMQNMGALLLDRDVIKNRIELCAN